MLTPSDSGYLPPLFPGAWPAGIQPPSAAPAVPSGAIPPEALPPALVPSAAAAEVAIDAAPASGFWSGARLVEILRPMLGGSVSLVVHLGLLLILAGIMLAREEAPLLVLQASSAAPAEGRDETPLVELEPLDLAEFPLATAATQPLDLTAAAPRGSADDTVGDRADDAGANLLAGMTVKALLDGLPVSAWGGNKGLYSGQFREMVEYSQKHGLDIVIVFDSTGSMGAEIEDLKRRIEHIVSTLLRKIPTARVGLVTYRDQGDNFVSVGVPLTQNLSLLLAFLSQCSADGGGDVPEAVDQGIYWALNNNQFTPAARKVVLLFGDAPPHSPLMPACVRMASAFRLQQKGVISTISCRQKGIIPEFRSIARAGGGEALTNTDPQRVMEGIVALIFGQQHRQDALRFFEFDKAELPQP